MKFTLQALAVAVLASGSVSLAHAQQNIFKGGVNTLGNTTPGRGLRRAKKHTFAMNFRIPRSRA